VGIIRIGSFLIRAARRLGRLRLVSQPVHDHPPVSALGFDPVINHPTLEEFKSLIAKKKGTTKGLIMDQAFSAGVGNVSHIATTAVGHP
jgi:formamidopyrimidine-DNA glycosylase